MKPTILVVDDDAAIREFTSMALLDEGYNVLKAENGQIALQLAAEAHPALILLDMRMPTMDGPTFIKTYRQQPECVTPIIVLTAGRHSTQSPAELGVEGFLAKPFDLNSLIELVETFVMPNDSAGD